MVKLVEVEVTNTVLLFAMICNKEEHKGDWSHVNVKDFGNRETEKRDREIMLEYIRAAHKVREREKMIECYITHTFMTFC